MVAAPPSSAGRPCLCLWKASGLIVLCLRSFALQSPSAPHTRRHTDLHGCAHETCTHADTHTDTHVHTQMQTHTRARPPTHTHTQLQGRWPCLGSAGRAGPGPSVCSGWSPQRGWELQGHPGCAGRSSQVGPAAQAFISLTGFWWPWSPVLSARLWGGWHAVFRAHRVAGAGDSLPEKPAYTGESCEVTGADLISHQKPRRPVWGGRGHRGGTGTPPGLLSAPPSLQPSSLVPVLGQNY